LAAIACSLITVIGRFVCLQRFALFCPAPSNACIKDKELSSPFRLIFAFALQFTGLAVVLHTKLFAL
jgi:hypothetical protein